MKILSIVRRTTKFINDKTYEFVAEKLSVEFCKTHRTWKVLEMGYEILNNKRIILEKKKVSQQLKAYHNVRPGCLLKNVIPVTARPEISIYQYKVDWATIPENSILMFVDVEHDKNYDSVVMKVLWNSKVYYIHKNSNLVDFSEQFDKKFQLLT